MSEQFELLAVSPGRAFKHTSYANIKRDGEWHLIPIPLDSIAKTSTFGKLTHVRVATRDPLYNAGIGVRVFDSRATAEDNFSAQSIFISEKTATGNTVDGAPGLDLAFNASERILYVTVAVDGAGGDVTIDFIVGGRAED